MYPLAGMACVILALVAKKGVDLFVNDDQPPAALKRGLPSILHLGVFCMAFGFLAQMIGLVDMFTAIEAVGAVAPSILAGGLKVSMIAPIFGFVIFLTSGCCWFVLKLRYEALVEEVEMTYTAAPASK